MQKEMYLGCLAADAAALAAAAGLGLAAPVPSCPGWSVADLVVHTGAVHRAQANLVATRAQEPVGLKREMFSSCPGLLAWFEHSVFMGEQSDLTAIPPGLIEWFEEGADILHDTLQATDPNEPVWSWSDTKRAAHYLRMMPIETAVHRWDAQSAHGRTEPIDEPLALDGIDHTFQVMLPFRRAHGTPPAGRGESYSFLPSDSPEGWFLRFDPEQVVVERGEHAADLTIRGAASDLFLFLWGRVAAGSLVVAGDRQLIDRYFELVPPL